MITVTLLNDSTLALSGGYEHKDAIKALEGATWDRKAKAWLVPLRLGPVLRRMFPAAQYGPGAAEAIEASFRRALAFNQAGFAQMQRVSPLINEYRKERGI